MCLIVVGWRIHPEFPLIVAANRDEFYRRASAPLGRWQDAPNLIAGRDLVAGGTWLGITDTGRFAAVTNVREPGAPTGVQSRGQLTQHFLQSESSPSKFAQTVVGTQFSGFNLLIADQNELVYLSNRGGQARSLAPGIYGLSNHLLDSPWPKLLMAKECFAEALAHLPDVTPFFALLDDDEIVADEALPDTGVSIEWERLLSAIFVKSNGYGTRAQTVLWQNAHGQLRIEEHTFGPQGEPHQSSVISTSV